MLNRAILMGRLVADPELRQTPTGVSVVSFRLAVDRSYSSRSGDQPQADFLPIIAWRSTAEFVSKYFHKGQLVAVEGRIQTRSWEDRQGTKHYATEIVADNVYFAESRRDGQSQGQAYSRRDNSSSRQDSTLQDPFGRDSVDEFQELSDDDDDGELPF